MKKWMMCVALLAGAVLFPWHANAVQPDLLSTEIPPQVQKALDESDVSAQEFSSMRFSNLFSWLKDQWKEQLTRPVRLAAELTAFLLLGVGAAAMAPEEHWRKNIETLLLAGTFLLAAQPILELMGEVAETVMGWNSYLAGFVPVFAGVMLGCGQSSTALIYSGMFLTMANCSAQVISTVAMPLLQVYLALCAAGGLCALDGVQDGCELIGKCVQWILKFASMLFGAVLGLQTVLAQGADNLALKTGRFVVSSAIPVVGSAASEAMGSVLAALRVLKGTLGFAAVAILAAAFVPLLLRCAAYALTMMLCAAAAKACGFKRTGTALNGMAKSISLCISFLVFFFMLVVLSTALMILAGNGG